MTVTTPVFTNFKHLGEPYAPETIWSTGTNITCVLYKRYKYVPWAPPLWAIQLFAPSGESAIAHGDTARNAYRDANELLRNKLNRTQPSERQQPMTTLQHSLFQSDEPKEINPKTTRSRLPEQRGQLKLFSEREVLQFGVKAHPLMPTSPHMKLPMFSRPPETDEERDARAEKEAKENTIPMFPPEPPSDNPPSDTYNGWPNKPTWAVFTWLTNTESTLSEIGELLSTASDPGSALRTWCEDYELWLGPFEVPCLGRDLIDWVIAVIDWDHAARALKEAAGH